MALHGLDSEWEFQRCPRLVSKDSSIVGHGTLHVDNGNVRITKSSITDSGYVPRRTSFILFVVSEIQERTRELENERRAVIFG